MSSDPNIGTLNQQNGAEAPAVGAGSMVPYMLCLAVLFAMAYGGWKWWQVHEFETTRGEAIPAGLIGPPLKEFELTERSGKPVRSIDMRGRVWVVT
jgi:hypothetical protein